MRLPKINSDELIPWCARHGVDACEIVAEQPETWNGKDGIRYRLRRYAPGASSWVYVEVVAPVDDPIPSLWVTP